MITFENVSKSFGAQRVLNCVNLEIPEGKITVIIGRSGEGKSVMLKHIVGLIKPDSGRLIVDGEDMASLGAVALNQVRKKFGMLFQNGALFDSMNVLENVAFPLREHTTMTESAIASRVRELLDLVGLQEMVMRKYPSELSGGMRKRVALARAVALKPRILLYDEPTTGLDPVMTDVVDHLILNTQRALGITSVVISHDIQAVYKVADKIAMLHEGKIHMQGVVADFQKTDDPFVRDFLEGRASKEQLKNL